jgi:hypothetical protein
MAIKAIIATMESAGMELAACPMGVIATMAITS